MRDIKLFYLYPKQRNLLHHEREVNINLHEMIDEFLSENLQL